MARYLPALTSVSIGFFALSCSAGGADPGNKNLGTAATSNVGGSPNLGVGGTTGDGIGGLNVGGTDGNVDPGCPTSISGTVYDPAGKLPLYNVVVYAPSEPLAPLSQGATCETCDGNFSGRPVAAAVSDAAGHFKLEGMPHGANVRVVIQVGKWRREVTIPNVPACQDTVMEDPELFRLPRNKSEGDLPKIAVVRGGSDALECIFHKIGVLESEFTTDTGDGRVHLYVSESDNSTAGTGLLGTTPLPTDDSLLDSLDKMKGYDMVLLGCEGTDGVLDSRPLEQLYNVRNYADQGGRIFGSHYHNKFVWNDRTEDMPYPEVVKFTAGAQQIPEPATGVINTSFPKGKALADWLQNISASTTYGEIPLRDVESTVESVLHPNAISWIGSPQAPTPGAPVYYSFPTPPDGAACGRMVFSSIHVASGSGDSGKESFPTGCASGPLTPQQAALAFMIFDLSSCVQPEKDDVKPPVIVK